MTRDTSKLVWTWVENETATHSALHCYYGRERKFMGEKYNGNSALCNKKLGVSEDGDSFLPIDKINSDPLNESAACQRCLKIYNSLTLTPPPTTLTNDGK